MRIPNPLIKGGKDLVLSVDTAVYGIHAPPALTDPAKAVADALENPIESESLRTIAKTKLAKNADATAVIVISDNTRPVPYKGEGNILVPIIEILLEEKYKKEK